ncbi:MAG: glycosyltransferase family 4 protein [Nostocoides sp.]
MTTDASASGGEGPGLPESALRIAVVGPSYPAKGGVAAHTTDLAHALDDAGHDVVLVSWEQMYPDRLYPGEQFIVGDPDVPPFPRTAPVLHWARPEGWVRTGRRLRHMDLIIIVHVVPQTTPAHLAILRAAGAGRPSGPRSLVITHNVLPHEPRPGDRALVRLMLSAASAVLVHSDEQAAAAAELGAHQIAVADLPPHLPGGSARPRALHDGPTRLLALGIVRPYKGLDLLLRALAEVPGPTLTIAGEMWADAGRLVRELVAAPALTGRVQLREGYVPAELIAPLLADHDVLTLTYRSATASQNAVLAHEHGLAVLASRVGTFPEQVRDGIDGLLVPAENHRALVEALTRLADPRYAARLRDGVTPPDLHGPWATYVGTIEALAAAPAAQPEEAVDFDEGGSPAEPSRNAGRARHAGHSHGAASAVGRLRRVVSSIRPASGSPPGARSARLELGRSDFPAWVRPTDVVTTEDETQEAVDLARALRLPRAGEPIATWAALGALAALVRSTDRGNRRPRDAHVIDASGPDSPFYVWAGAAGYDAARPLTDAWTEDDPGGDGIPSGIDSLVQLYPNDVDAGDVDAFLMAAEWSVRPGGLVMMTLIVGGPRVPGAVAPADVRSVLARADDRSLELIGDLDGDLTARLRGAGLNARGRSDEASQAAYGLVRLAFRRR